MGMRMRFGVREEDRAHPSERARGRVLRAGGEAGVGSFFVSSSNERRSNRHSRSHSGHQVRYHSSLVPRRSVALLHFGHESIKDIGSCTNSRRRGRPALAVRRLPHAACRLAEPQPWHAAGRRSDRPFPGAARPR
jgi:hypothetical protein